MYLYFILQGKACHCDVSAVDCSVGLGAHAVESDKAIFVDFGTQEVSYQFPTTAAFNNTSLDFPLQLLTHNPYILKWTKYHSHSHCTCHQLY